MNENSSGSFCKPCVSLFSCHNSWEDNKEEENLCSYCSKSSAALLSSGAPSCFSCFQLRKSQQILKARHQTKRSQGSPTMKSLSPRKIEKNSNFNIQSLKTLKTLAPFETKGGSTQKIAKLQSDEDISKSYNLAAKKKQSVFKTSNTQELPSASLSKYGLAGFIENLAKKGLDVNSALYHAKDGNFSSKEFHEKCDRHMNLIVIVLFTSGYILGTFQESPLDPEQMVVSDEKATIFSIFGGEKVFLYDVTNHKMKYEVSGLSFGVPTQLLLNLDVIDESFCSLELKYKSPLGGDVKFKIAENFVWSLIVKEVLAFKLS